MFFKFKGGRCKSLSKKVMSILCSVFFIANAYVVRAQHGESEEESEGFLKGKYFFDIDVSAEVSSSYDQDGMYDVKFYDDIKRKYETGGYSNEADALKISEADQLAAFARLVNMDKYNFSGRYVSLTSDIYLRGTKPTVEFVDKKNDNEEEFIVKIKNPKTEGGDETSVENAWTPIGSSKNTSFAGVFDGGGHVIKNMVVNKSESCNAYSGLFGYVKGGKIKNVGIEESIAIASTSARVSTLYCAYSGGIAGCIKSSSISNCYNRGDVYCYSSNYRSAYSGGIAGCIKSSSISNCYNTGEVSLSVSCHNAESGGIVGRSCGNIINCYNTGGVYSSSYLADISNDCSGGIAGSLNGGEISNCYNIGEVSSYNAAGGVSGCMNSSSTSNCYNEGNIYSYNVGSIGRAFSGGIVGFPESSSIISYCYNTGGVSAISFNAYSGGIVGHGTSSTVRICYNAGVIFSSFPYCGYDVDCDSCVCSGGISGYLCDGEVSNCYNTGPVGSAGYGMHTHVYSGGILGSLDAGEMVNCYNIGTVDYDGEAITHLGEVCGENSGSIKNCFYDRFGLVYVSENDEGEELTNEEIMIRFEDAVDENGIKIWSFGSLYPLLNILISKIRATISFDGEDIKLTNEELIGDLKGPHVSEEEKVLLYSWKKDDQPIPDVSGNTYKVSSDDIGSVISCTLASSNYIGSCTFSQAIPDSYLTISNTTFTYGDIDCTNTTDLVDLFGIMSNSDGTISLQYKKLSEDDTQYVDLPSNGYLDSGTYKLKATQAQSGFYLSKEVEKEFTVKKATPSYEEPTALSALCGQKLEDVELPEGWEWENPYETVGEVGNQTFMATYSPEDVNNYNSVTVQINVTVNVGGSLE